jgi:hypothetical protein
MGASLAFAVATDRLLTRRRIVRQTLIYGLYATFSMPLSAFWTMVQGKH